MDAAGRWARRKSSSVTKGCADRNGGGGGRKGTVSRSHSDAAGAMEWKEGSVAYLVLGDAAECLPQLFGRSLVFHDVHLQWANPQQSVSVR